MEAGEALTAGLLTSKSPDTNKKGPDLSGPICMNPKLLRALSGRQGSYFFFLAGAFLAAFFAAFFVAFFID